MRFYMAHRLIWNIWKYLTAFSLPQLHNKKEQKLILVLESVPFLGYQYGTNGFILKKLSTRKYFSLEMSPLMKIIPAKNVQ